MKKKCANVVPAENGNNENSPPILDEDIKTINAKYKYDFVINNYTENEVCQVIATLKKIAKKGGFGKEVGDEEQTPHLQGFISLKRKLRITGITKLPGFERASLRETRNEKALIDYCMKDNCFFKIGFPKPLRVITELRPFQKTIEAICSEEPDDRTINILIDADTKIGKTQFTKYMVYRHQAIAFTGGKASDIACQLAQEVENGRDLNDNTIMLFNYGEGKRIDKKPLENVKDGLITSPKYKTSTIVFNSPHIWVFCNEEPDDIINSKRKDVWKLWKVDEKLELVEY